MIRRFFTPAAPVAVLLALLVVPGRAWSQSAPDAPATQPPADAPTEALASPVPVPPRPMNVTWQDGLVIESQDGDYRVQMGAFIRTDARIQPDGLPTAAPNTFVLKTLRATFQGRVAKYFTFRLQPDFSGSTTAPVSDAWIDVGFSDALHVRVGRDRVPIGMEVLLQDSNVVFLERGLTVNLMPQRDTGVQVYGDLPGGRFSYAAGVYNGQVDGAANNTSATDTDNAKDLAGRFVARPFARPAVRALRPLELLTLAVGASTGQQHNAPLESFKTSMQQTYFGFAPGAIADGRRTRLAPEMSFHYKTLGGYAEVARLRQVVRLGGTSAELDHTAWQVVGSWILTGETSGERVRPRRAFDPERHQWGAFQLAARYGRLAVDRQAFALGLVDPASSREIAVATLGANWYLTTNVKMQFNAERSVFDHDPSGRRPVEHGLLVRLQLNY